MRLRRRRVTLTHQTPGEGMFSDATVHIELPATLEVVGETILALSKIGYEIPAARGRTKMYLDCGSCGRAVINLATGETEVEYE